jgi:hypothetical protein
MNGPRQAPELLTNRVVRELYPSTPLKKRRMIFTMTSIPSSSTKSTRYLQLHARKGQDTSSIKLPSKSASLLFAIWTVQTHVTGYLGGNGLLHRRRCFFGQKKRNWSIEIHAEEAPFVAALTLDIYFT